ncbi:MAG: hypothetical protein BWY77_00801 [bacterium ADurb.Bin431]|nr:MAG: hypothetical protein BWY77_00801 [bacterium ADurb.Bin431]
MKMMRKKSCPTGAMRLRMSQSSVALSPQKKLTINPAKRPIARPMKILMCRGRLARGEAESMTISSESVGAEAQLVSRNLGNSMRKCKVKFQQGTPRNLAPIRAISLAPAANSRSHRYISLPPQSRTHLTRPFAIFQQFLTCCPLIVICFHPGETGIFGGIRQFSARWGGVLFRISQHRQKACTICLFFCASLIMFLQ